MYIARINRSELKIFMDTLFYIYLVLINIAGFAFMGIDKRIACLNGDTRDKKGHTKYTRIPEAVLMTTAFAFGAVGCMLGMKLFHHKTKKPKFYLGMPFMLLVNVALLYVLFLR